MAGRLVLRADPAESPGVAALRGVLGDVPPHPLHLVAVGERLSDREEVEVKVGVAARVVGVVGDWRHVVGAERLLDDRPAGSKARFLVVRPLQPPAHLRDRLRTEDQLAGLEHNRDAATLEANELPDRLAVEHEAVRRNDGMEAVAGPCSRHLEDVAAALQSDGPAALERALALRDILEREVQRLLVDAGEEVRRVLSEDAERLAADPARVPVATPDACLQVLRLLGTADSRDAELIDDLATEVAELVLQLRVVLGGDPELPEPGLRGRLRRLRRHPVELVEHVIDVLLRVLLLIVEAVVPGLRHLTRLVLGRLDEA